MTTERTPRATSTLSARARGEVGGVSVEWLAAGSLVVVLLGALLTPALTGRMGESFAYAACRIIANVGGDGDCTPPGEGEGGPDGEVPTITCLTSQRSESAGGHVTLFSVRVDGDLAYQIDSLSDDTFEVTLQMSGSLGAELVAGGKISADELGLQAGREGSVNAALGGEVAPVFSFDTLEEAEAFAQSARDIVTGPTDDLLDWKTLIPIYGPGRIPVNQINRIRNFDPPPPSGLRIQGGLEVQASGTWRGGGAGLDGMLGAGRHLGADIDFDTGHTTVYVALDSEVALGMGLDLLPGPVRPGVGADGQLQSEVVVGLTVDENLNPVELGLSGTIQGSGGIQGLGEGDLHEIFSGLANDLEVGVNGSDHDAFSLSAGATLDLTDPALAQIGDDFLAALGSRDPGQLADAGGNFVDHLVNQTDIEAQLHTGDRSVFDIEGKGGKGLAFGGGFNTESSNLDLAGAWHRPPGGSFSEANCG
ncbi:hypothetical protein FTX61_19230 [Nitriliruptoraceae bacterium ZYF776]|nr:hypothetical protein [Profundirhabdus halotolerans]